MPSQEIVPASRFPVAELAGLMNRGYADYFTPIHLEPEAFVEMVTLQDIVLEASPVEVRDGVPAGIALLGLRGERGWIGGLAVPPEARRHGTGRRLMGRAIELAKERGARRMDLEVLVQNEPAIPLYTALGFRDTRRLGVFTRPALAAGATANPATPLPAPAELFPRHEASVEECIAMIPDSGPLVPPWQRGRPVAERCAATSVALGVRRGGALVASAILRVHPARAAILHLGAEREASPREIAELIEAIVARYGDRGIALLNHPEGNPIAAALPGAGFGVPFRQREMRLDL